MRKTPIDLTTHAIERYQERMESDLSLAEAQDALHLRLSRAELVNYDGITFEYVFRGAPSGRAIVKRRSAREGGGLLCVTVKFPSVRQAELEEPPTTMLTAPA